MTQEQFKYLFSEEVGANGFLLVPTEDPDKEVWVFREPLQIWESETDKEVNFKNVDELLAYSYKGKLVSEYVDEMDKLIVSLHGSTGGDGKEKTFKFSHARDNGKDNTQDLFPAYANVRIKDKTLEGAMQEFHERFKNADKEWAYEIDEQGYVHQYKEGNTSSVSISGTNKNNMILHNHPSGGNFSDSDLISVSAGNEKGIVASGKNGDYVFQKKGGHFKASEFIKAVKRAKMQGTSYDDAVDKWLKANQKKYGYTYKFIPDKNNKNNRPGAIDGSGRPQPKKRKYTRQKNTSNVVPFRRKKNS